MPWWSSSRRVWRVSSAAIRSAPRSTWSARSVMSARFPSGVATTYNAGGMDDAGSDMMRSKLRTGRILGCTEAHCKQAGR